MIKIAVIGTGYVGLTTGACFAHLGHEVVCADIDADKVAHAPAGRDPDPRGRARQPRPRGPRRRSAHVRARRRHAPSRDCEFAYLCVPTPQGADGSADLSYIEAAAREIGPVLPSEAIVVNKSTVPSGPPGSSSGRSAAATSPSCRTRSSSARARPSTTSSTPTAS